MNAFRLTEWGRPPERVQIPIPTPGSGQVLVRVAGCGLGRADVTAQSVSSTARERHGWVVPYTLGQETTGHVAQLGAGVTGIAEGEPVAVLPRVSCGQCWHCLRGVTTSCPSSQVGHGYGRDGGLADYVLVDQRENLLALGTLDPWTSGPLINDAASAYHAVRRIRQRVFPDGVVVVFGVDGPGSCAIQLLRLLTSARVFAVDDDPTRRDRAERVGAHTTCSTIEAAAEALHALTGGRGADAALRFGSAEAPDDALAATVRDGGAYGIAGRPGSRLSHASLPDDGELFTFRRPSGADVREVVSLAAAGPLRGEVTEFGFDQVEEAYALLAAGELPGGRAVIVLDRETASRPKTATGHGRRGTSAEETVREVDITP